MKMTAFWDVAPCSLAEADRRFRGSYLSSTRIYFYSLHFIGMENGITDWIPRLTN
jgi:hypothetical protein